MKTINMKTTNQHPWYVAFRNAGLILIAASLLTYAPLSAQDEETEEGEKTELIELPEFRVDDSQEFGYRATSSATAIRLAAQSIDLPMNISILPAEFIEDLAFDSIQEALPLHQRRLWRRARFHTRRGRDPLPSRFSHPKAAQWSGELWGGQPQRDRSRRGDQGSGRRLLRQHCAGAESLTW